MNMVLKIVIGIIVVGILFLTAVFYQKASARKQIREVLKGEWGIYTRDEYSDKIMENIRYYHEKKKTDTSIDDITWNDLNMDAVFKRMNHTRTSAGEEYLYHVLRSPVFSEEELLRRENVIKSIQEQEEGRNDLELALYDIGKTDNISVYEHLSELNALPEIKKWPHILAAVLLFTGIVTVFFASTGFLFFLFFLMGINAYFYYKKKAEVLQAIALFSFILGTIRQCGSFMDIKLEGCKEYFLRLKELSDKFQVFCRFRFLVSGGSTMSGNLFDSVFDYVRILFHVDLIKLGTMVREVQKYGTELLELYDIIGFLDSMLAVASYREMAGTYTVPRFSQADSRNMTARGIYHPLVSQPVKNDFHTKKCMLLTGSNASGKSTFIKTVAVNALFAQTIHTVLADLYEACFYRIYSSMALRDNILSEESYFIVEIKSLKRIFEKTEESGIPVLCFIDEILRGTNTVERVAASSELLEALSKKNAMCFAATHDIELTYLLEESFENYHFAEHIRNDDILFDYLLKEGRADSRNAIRLLAMTGFEKELTENAQKRVETFLAEGIWC